MSLSAPWPLTPPGASSSGSMKEALRNHLERVWGGMNRTCAECGRELRVRTAGALGIRHFLQIEYCAECRVTSTSYMLPLCGLRGKAASLLNRGTGEFRLSVQSPEEFRQVGEVTVRTFPSYVANSLQLRAGNLKARGAEQVMRRVYPEVRRNDEVVAVGFMLGDILVSVLVKDLTLGGTKAFIESETQLEIGIADSFTVTNPLLLAAERIVTELEKRTTSPVRQVENLA